MPREGFSRKHLILVGQDSVEPGATLCNCAPLAAALHPGSTESRPTNFSVPELNVEH